MAQHIKHRHCCGLGLCSGMGLIPGPGTSAWHGCGPPQRVVYTLLRVPATCPTRGLCGCIFSVSLSKLRGDGTEPLASDGRWGEGTGELGNHTLEPPLGIRIGILPLYTQLCSSTLLAPCLIHGYIITISFVLCCKR